MQYKSSKQPITHIDESTKQPAPTPLQGEERKADETVSGGKYIVNGVLVDCNGKEIKA